MSNCVTMRDLKVREATVFNSIPGMKELLQARPEEQNLIEEQYPDAVFAVSIANSLFNHDRELSEISQKAYFSILNGESIDNVRFIYNRETDIYWQSHMWDD